MTRITPAELELFLDEALPVEELTRIEQALRADPTIVEQASLIHSRRDSGLHSLGEIWRRHRLTCPNRDQWGSFLLGAMAREQAAYCRFHLETIGCRYCSANVDDLRRQQAEQAEVPMRRRTKYFASSAGYLRPRG